MGIEPPGYDSACAYVPFGSIICSKRNDFDLIRFATAEDKLNLFGNYWKRV